MKNMKIKINKTRSYVLSAAALAILLGSCKKQLDVKDPNDPTPATVITNEAGITSFAKGGIYWTGFNYGDGWLGDSYFSLPWGYHELMGDVVGGGQGSNNQTTTMGVPDKFQADPNDPTTVFTNPSPQATGIIRSYNNSASTVNGNNALYYEWLNMYAMNNACNLTLEYLPTISGLSTDKVNTIKAWAYWWKGYAYAQIGTLYYAGLILNSSTATSNKFVKQSDMINESNKYLNLAITTLNAITNQGDYNSIMAKLILQQNQTGLGMPPTSAMFVRTINTMLARNILFNKLAPFVNGNPNATITKASVGTLSAADWTAIINYCNNGVKQGDYVFTGRTSDANSFFSKTGGSVAGILTQSNQTTTYKVSERLVQSFKSGDKRLANFTTANGTFYGDANTNSTRWTLVDGVTKGLTGIPILGSRQVGGLEIYIGPTYEENQLMLAEANIRSGSINAGLINIDNVRAYQGAGVAPIAGTGLTLAQAMQELTLERYAALAFRGLSFYDARRWGWTYSTSNGGGRYGATLIFKSTLYNNATISYNFMDYWDVPADELEKNPASSDSAPTKNPNY
jgi:hypothetical protein